jgi:Rad3-related DNA helicase
MTVLEDFSPADLGFDTSKFVSWRDGQFQVVLDAVDCQTRFSGHCAPCGTGKTGAYVGFARATGSRTLILTSFKGLQEQVTGDFRFVTDLRGKANYWCHYKNTNCDLASACCDARSSVFGGSLCPHKIAVGAAQSAEIVVTNYSCWLHQFYGQGLGNFDAIVLDEADQAEASLSEFLSFTLDAREALGDLKFKQAPHWADSLNQWSEWAAVIRSDVAKMSETAEQNARTLGDKQSLERHLHVRSLARKIALLSRVNSNEWVAEQTRDGIRFDPIWPGSFAEQYLFRGISRILLFSGTLNKKTFDLLGVKSEDYTFYDYPSPFHPARNPLILCPVGDFRYPVKEELIDEAVSLFDCLADQRMNVKGILHTVSFRHLEQFIERSKHRNLFLANDVKYLGGTRRTSDVVETFKMSSPPAILASPSITAGWDFPGCLTPDMRVLTADLRWIPSGDVKEGDVLAGFDEESPSTNRSRQWRKSVVTGCFRYKKPCYKLTLEDGAEVKCSIDHMWLVTNPAHGHKWAKTDNLRVPSSTCKLSSYLGRVLDIWSEGRDWRSGYIAAAFDGEGSLCHTINIWNRGGPNTNIALAFTQTDNEMLYKLMDILREEQINFRHYKSDPKPPVGRKRKCKNNVNITGREDILRMLGWSRPVRLLPKFDVERVGSLRVSRTKIVEREYIGFQEVVVMETTTRTFIAEGFASHNSQCRWQFVLKVPWPDTQSLVAKERKKLDPEYHDHQAMTSLVQIASRSCRSDLDYCQNITPDTRVAWFLKRKQHLAPSWFIQGNGYKRFRSLYEGVLPEPLRD